MLLEREAHKPAIVLTRVFIVDNLEHERKKGAEYLVEILQVKAHVEGLDIGL